MAEETPKQEQQPDTRKPEQIRDAQLEEAIERVYRKYGSDLAAFLRDVQQEILLKQEGSPKRSEHQNGKDRYERRCSA